MKFKIRFADKIVGFFIVFSLAALFFVVAALGRSQRWFAKDLDFYTILPTAAGLSKNMPIQYRGFTIGFISNFHLADDDNVEVILVIHEEYVDRVRLGSMVEIMVSPVGLGNQFLFHSGRGDPMDEGSFLPIVGSPQARELIRQGLAVEPRHDDSITVLLGRANSILDDLGKISGHLETALGLGSSETEIGRIVGSVQRTLTGAENIPLSVDQTINELRSEIRPLLANINAIIRQLNEPDGLLYTVLDTEQYVYTNLVSSLQSVSSILDNLDRVTAFIPGQLPQIAVLISELRTTISSAEDLMVSLANNPLLRGGIPDRLEAQSSTTNPRGIRF